MEPNDGWLAGSILDGHNVETQWAFLDVAFTEEIVGGANQDFVLVLRNAHFRQCGLAFDRQTGADLHNGKGVGVVANQSSSPFARDGI
ncbi:MAG: hypothetical protein WBL63_13465 [Candidatus Acidiferrum sp.]